MVRICSLVLLLLTLPALAVIETYEFSDSALEKRYRALSEELRCPKCQNQNIADSNAPISQDLRRVLYEELEEGASDQEILDHMVARYGEYVLLRPDARGANIVLWLAAPALLLIALGIGWSTIRTKRAAPTRLSDEEQVELEKILRS